ncbi:hypothetical protein ABIA30_001072 [Mycobacterium sp. MAA66]|uniref:iron reductase n=1 Tax=Mycobacterium sp. MAA66 TaxID=3156297 RepID=UPI003519363B
MTVTVDDPLIAAMDIRSMLPLHESSKRLRDLFPDGPRVYGVAIMGDLSRRRWWPLADALDTGRLELMFDAAVAETGSAVVAARQLAATFAHVVIGRVVPLLVLEGRVWDNGLENLWVHVDSEGSIDWVGVVNPLLRALPDDPHFGSGGARAARPMGEGIVALPSEAALTTWVAHRAHRALEPLFGKLHQVSGGALAMASMWHIVGSAVVGSATLLPVLVRGSGMGSTEEDGMRRAQAVLDALVGFGAPVRGTNRAWPTKGLLN